MGTIVTNNNVRPEVVNLKKTNISTVFERNNRMSLDKNHPSINYRVNSQGTLANANAKAKIRKSVDINMRYTDSPEEVKGHFEGHFEGRNSRQSLSTRDTTSSSGSDCSLNCKESQEFMVNA